MKHAILVTAHGDMSVLKCTLRILDSEYIDFFIHVDAKTKISDNEFDGVCKKSKVIVLPNNIDVYWGAYSIIESQLLLLKASTVHTYDYYHFLSGADLPIKSVSAFLDFFEQNGPDVEYVAKWHDSEKNWNRINYKYPFLKLYRRSKYEFINNVQKAILARLLRFPSSKKELMKGKELYCGDNWSSMTHTLAMYVLSNEEWIYKMFSTGYTTDELYVQTLLINSPELKDRRSNFSTRLIDWKRGKPYVWRISDLPEILNSDALFCRKFSMKADSEIVYAIEKHLLNN